MLFNSYILPAIIASEDTKFVVSIIDNMMYTAHVASGSILSSRFVLTNARPLARWGHTRSFSSLVIVVDIQKTWDNGIHYRVAQEIINPNFDRDNKMNDIGLLYTALPIEFGDRAQPISISSRPVLSNQDSVFSGYGFNEKSSTIHVPLNVVKFVTISNDECKQILGGQNAEMIFETKVCVSPKDNRVICSNDNGAPLSIDNELVGISSWNVPCAHNSPVVAERVAPHLDFIRQYVA